MASGSKIASGIYNAANSNAEDEGIFDEDRIPKELQSLDQTLRCKICMDLFKGAVMIKDCGHTFCSICIRSFFQKTNTGTHRQDNQCPECRYHVGDLVDKALGVNRSIQEAVIKYKQLLVNMHKSNQNSLLSGESKTYSHHRRSSLPTSARHVSSSDDECDGGEHEDDEHEVIDDDNDEKPIDKRIPSRNYSQMKKKQLQDFCVKYGLSSRGTDKELRERCKSFVTMWNAELDSISPKRPSEIVAQVKRREQAEMQEKWQAIQAGATRHSDYLNKINRSLSNGATGAQVTSGDPIFDQKMSENYDALIAKARSKPRQKPRMEESTSTDAIDDEDNRNMGDANDGTSKSSNNPNALLDSPAEAINVDAIDHSKNPTAPQDSPAVAIDVDAIDFQDNSSENASSGGKENEMTTSPSDNAKLAKTKTPTSSIRNPYLKSRTPSAQRTAAPVTSNRQPRPSQNGEEKKRPSPASTAAKIYPKRNRVEWECKHCTFRNAANQSVCEVCHHMKMNL